MMSCDDYLCLPAKNYPSLQSSHDLAQTPKYNNGLNQILETSTTSKDP